MRKVLLAVLLMALSAGCFAEARQALTLHMQTGAKVLYYLDKEPSISFAGQDMVITEGAEPSVIPMADVHHWEIASVDSGDSGISENAMAEAPSIFVIGNQVRICNPQGCAVGVYHISGQAVATSAQQDFSLNLASGVYVITIGKNSYKIAIK